MISRSQPLPYIFSIPTAFWDVRSDCDSSMSFRVKEVTRSSPVEGHRPFCFSAQPLFISVHLQHIRGNCDGFIPFDIKENAIMVQGEGRRFIRYNIAQPAIPGDYVGPILIYLEEMRHCIQWYRYSLAIALSKFSASFHIFAVNAMGPYRSTLRRTPSRYKTKVADSLLYNIAKQATYGIHGRSILVHFKEKRYDIQRFG